ARGGSLSGDGGFIETSAEVVELDPRVNVGADNGVVGTWLIDPYNVTIKSSCIGTCEIPEYPTGTFTADRDESVLTTTTLLGALTNGADVLVETSDAGGQLEPKGGNITLAHELDLNGAVSGTATLTLRAHHDINIDSRIWDSAYNNDRINLSLQADINGVGGGDVIIA
ncbi:MAG: hypothetical protein GY815_06615, partial [Gammaproteobacteria bacterium]|nr:hypothetical protein [Gammaproteobacteria bacterium]